MKNRFLVLFFLLIVLNPLRSFSDQYPQLYFSPGFLSIPLHSVGIVEVWIEDVANLKGYSVRISYDPSFISILSIAEGDLFTSPTFFASFVDTMNGIVRVESAMLGIGRKADGTGSLFRLELYGKSQGTDTLRFVEENLRDGDLKRIEVEFTDGVLAIGEPVSVRGDARFPQSFMLFQNYPNPFNPETTFSFYLPQPSIVSLHLFDTSGRLVHAVIERESYGEGLHRKRMNAEDLPSGTYYYRVHAVSEVSGERYGAVRSMVLIR